MHQQLIVKEEVSLSAYQNTSDTFNWLYENYWQTLLNQSYYYLKDLSVAEEIVQQLFIDIFRKNILIRETTNTDGYLRKAIRNRSLNYLLKNKRYHYHLKKLGENTRQHAENVIEEDINLVHVQNQIHLHLSTLSDSCRTVFILNRDRQMTIKQIAQKLNRPEDTVTKQLGKAVRHLYKCLYPGVNNN
jgi:RNA polymerase sigma-70 factor (ECF subfamily)